MEVSHLSELKPRTVWEITDDAFDLYRERFVLMASIAAVVFVPMLLVYNVVTINSAQDIAHVGDGPTYFFGFFRNFGAVSLFLTIAYMVQFGATALAVRDVLTGEPTSLGSVYKRTFKRFWALLFATLLIDAVAVLLACTVIGWIFVPAYFAFVAHIVLLEDRKMWDAMKRSRDMARNFFGKSFGLICLMGGLSFLLSVGFNSVIAAVYSALPSMGAHATPYEQEHSKQILEQVSSSVITLITVPLFAIATTLLYYDLRVRREGLDIEAEAERLDIALAPDPFGGVLNPKLPKKGAKR